MRIVHPDTDPRCFIVGAGTNDVIPPAPQASDIVIAADGGLDFLEQIHLPADFVIGDFDSASHTPAHSDSTIALPSEKDDTDMTSAVKLGWSKGFRQFHIYGGLGGRLDHTLANIQLLAGIAAHGGIGFLHSSQTCVTALCSASLQLAPHAPAMVSVFAHSDTAHNVTIKGLKYEVRNVTLTNSTPLGVSNEFRGTQAHISVDEGTLIVTIPNTARPDSVHLNVADAASFGALSTHVSQLLAPKPVSTTK
jgi:thiamine pyrophosphokinase